MLREKEDAFVFDVHSTEAAEASHCAASWNAADGKVQPREEKIEMTAARRSNIEKQSSSRCVAADSSCGIREAAAAPMWQASHADRCS